MYENRIRGMRRRTSWQTVLTEWTESLAVKGGAESAAMDEQLMEEVCRRENCKQALARVKANKGSAGGDGMIVQPLPEHLKRLIARRGPRSNSTGFDGSYYADLAYALRTGTPGQAVKTVFILESEKFCRF